MKKKPWGSAPTLDGIQQVIKAFYCGSVKTLRRVDESEWAIVNGDLTETRTVVRFRKDRYYLESRDD